MFRGISKDISKLTTSEILKYKFQVKLFFGLILLTYTICVVIFMVNSQIILATLCNMLMIFLVFPFYVLLDNAISKGINMVLTETLSPESYLEVLEATSPYKQRQLGSKHYALKSVYIINKSYALIAKGQFEESLSLLNEIDFKRFNRYQKKQLGSIYYLLRYSAILFSNQDYLLDTFIEPLKQLENEFPNNKELFSRRVKLIQAMDDVMTRKKVSHYFEIVEPSTRLEKISFTYFEALSELLEGNQEKAQTLFQEISSKNPELFYVEEARRCLKQMQ